MYGQSFKDRIAEHKGTIIKVVAVIGIAAIISAVMVMALAVGKDTYTKTIERLEGGITVVGSKAADTENDVDDILALGPLATAADLAGVTSQTVGLAANLSALETRQDIDHAKIVEHGQTLTTLTGSPPEGYLTGTFANSTGNYTLHARCSEAGNFTANVHLFYSRAFGFNGTYEEAQQYFYSGINWTQGTPWYRTVITYNSTDWHLSELWWNIGVFALTANNETTIPVVFGGLNATYAPDFAYVDIWPVLQ